jgi:hypothetical protein
MAAVPPLEAEGDVASRSRAPIGRLAVIAAWIVALAVTGFGLAVSDLKAIPLWGDGLGRAAWVVAGSLAVSAACFALGPRRRIPGVLTALGIWLTAIFGVGAIAVTGALGLAAYSLGAFVFGESRRQRFGLAASALISIPIGLALLMAVLTAAAHVPINNQAAYATALLLLIAAGRRRVADLAAGLAAWTRRSAAITTGDYLALSMFLTTLVVVSVPAALPEQYHDALALHLNVASTVAAQGRWVFRPAEFIFSVSPFGANWLFTVGYVLAGETGAKAVNFALLGLVAALLSLETARQHGRSIGLIVGALFVSMPLAGIETASLFVENALTALLLAAFVLLVRAWPKLEAGDIVALGTLMGGAALIKLPAGFFILPLSALAALSLLRTGPARRAFGLLLLFGGIGLAVGLQPYVTAWVLTGNPVFPFFNAVFRSPLFDMQANFSDPRWTGWFGPALLYRWTFESGKFLEAYNGAIGFALILLLLPGLAWSLVRRHTPSLLAAFICLAYLLGMGVSTQYLRYFFPIFPLFFLIAAGALDGVARPSLRLSRLRGGVLAVAGLLAAVQLLFLPAAGWILASYDVQVLLDRTRQQKWIGSRVAQRRLIDLVNADAGRSARVLMVGHAVGAGLDGLPVYYNWYNPKLLGEVGAVTSPLDVARVLVRNGITHVISSPQPNLPIPFLDDLLEKQADLLGSLHGARLHRLRISEVSGDELLRNADFQAGLSGWGLLGSPALDGGKPVLAAAEGVVQSVPVPALATMIYKAEAACAAGGSSAVLQVNWHDASGRMIDVFSSVLDCTGSQASSFVERILSPAGAATASVYFHVRAGGPVRLERLSFLRA